jgi:GTP-binding protein Era
LLFAEDEITDRSERFLAAEYIREKLFRLIGDELPYGAAVEVEKFVVDGALRRISAAILVDREGHKSIIIGKGGEMVKRIASEAQAGHGADVRRCGFSRSLCQGQVRLGRR